MSVDGHSRERKTHILRVYFDRQDKIWVVDLSFYAFVYLEQDPGSVLQAAAVFVGSTIDPRRKKLGEQVPMGRVQLNTIDNRQSVRHTFYTTFHYVRTHPHRRYEIV